MKKFVLTLFSSILCFISFGQVPGTKWQNYIAPYRYMDEVFYDIQPTKDKGFIAAGVDTGWIAKNVALNKSVLARLWLVKLDSNGNRSWDTHAGQRGAFFSAMQTADLGYVLAGYSHGIYPDGDPGNVYLAKYSNEGRFLWDKKYGGKGNDRAFNIKAVNDDGFIVTGFTTSNDGDAIGNHSGDTADIWLLRLDNNGNKRWAKAFGGSGNDTAHVVLQTPDHGFLIAGVTESNDGDVSSNAGDTDAWVFKTDSSGNLLWQKTFGGSGNEAFKSVVLNNDGTYTFVGYSASATVLGENGAGQKDLWVVKTTLNGDVIWSKLFGGSKDEQGFSVQATPEGNNIVSGYTESNDGIGTGNNGGADALLLKISPAGALLWKKCVGTANDEASMASVCLSETDFVMAGFGKQPGYSDFDGYVVHLGNANIIQGTLFKDDNLNGVKDAIEDFFSLQATVNVQKQNGAYTRSQVVQNGQFSISVDTGSYVTTVQVGNSYYKVVPDSQASSFSTYFNTAEVSFALQPIPGKQDLSIALVPLGVARPGFEESFQLIYKNVGQTTIPTGQIWFEKDRRTNFLTASPNLSTIDSNFLKWSYSNLIPGDERSIVLNLRIAPPPQVNNGDTLSFKAIINPADGDETPHDDTAVLKQIVVGSYDPNDKAESNAGSIPLSFVTDGNALQYTIRFQNTGTDTAFTIVVRDTLSNRLQAGTLEMVAASHPYTLNIENGVNLAWTFPNILLPDSIRNEPASHGYIVYRIKPKSDLAKGETIHNTASIYFDYNLPIVTNDAATIVQMDLVTLPQQLLHFYGNLQKETVQLNWKIAPGTSTRQFEVERSVDGDPFHSISALLTAPAQHNYAFTDNIATVPGTALLYRLKLVQQNGQAQYSDRLLFRKEKAVAGSIAVYPNPVKKEAWIVYFAAAAGKASLQVLNAAGAVVSRRTVAVQKGKNVYAFSENGALLPPGLYTVQFTVGETLGSRTVIVL